jgi:hypothetical protein
MMGAEVIRKHLRGGSAVNVVTGGRLNDGEQPREGWRGLTHFSVMNAVVGLLSFAATAGAADGKGAIHSHALGGLSGIQVSNIALVSMDEHQLLPVTSNGGLAAMYLKFVKDSLVSVVRGLRWRLR